MANTLYFSANGDATTKVVQFYNPVLQTWVDGTLVDSATKKYTATMAGIPAGFYTGLKSRLKGSIPEIVSIYSEGVTVRDGNTLPTPTALTLTFTIASATAAAGGSLSYSAAANGGTAPYKHLVQAENADTGVVKEIGSASTPNYAGIWQPLPAGTYDLTDTVTDAAGTSKISPVRRVVISPAAPVGKKLLILVVANSQGFGPTGSSDSEIGTAGHEAWPDQVAARYQAAAPGTVELRAFARSGATSQELRDIVQNDLKPWLAANLDRFYQVDAICQELTNDTMNHDPLYSKEQVYEAFKLLLTDVKAVPGVTSISTITCYQLAPQHEVVAQWCNTQLKEFRNALGLKQIFDVRTAPYIGKMQDGYTDGGVHFNHLGNAEMGKFMYNGLVSGASLYIDPAYVAPSRYTFANSSFESQVLSLGGPNWQQFQREWVMVGNGEAVITNASGSQNSWLFFNDQPLEVGKSYKIEVLVGDDVTGTLKLITKSGNSGSGATLLPGAGFVVFTAQNASDQFIFAPSVGASMTIHAINITEYVIPTQKGLLLNWNNAVPATGNQDTGYDLRSGVVMLGNGRLSFDASTATGNQVWAIQRVKNLDTTKQYRLRVKATITSGSLGLIYDPGVTIISGSTTFVNGVNDFVFVPSAATIQFIFAASYPDGKGYLEYEILALDDANFPTA